MSDKATVRKRPAMENADDGERPADTDRERAVRATSVEGYRDASLDPTRWKKEHEVKLIGTPRLIGSRARGCQIYMGFRGKLLSISDFIRRDSESDAFSPDFRKQVTLTKTEFDQLMGSYADICAEYDRMETQFDKHVEEMRATTGSGLVGASGRFGRHNRGNNNNYHRN